MWVENTTSLQWSNTTGKLPVFVADQVSETLESSSIDEWFHKLSGPVTTVQQISTTAEHLASYRKKAVGLKVLIFSKLRVCLPLALVSNDLLKMRVMVVITFRSFIRPTFTLDDTTDI